MSCGGCFDLDLMPDSKVTFRVAGFRSGVLGVEVRDCRVRVRNARILGYACIVKNLRLTCLLRTALRRGRNHFKGFSMFSPEGTLGK